MRSTEAGVDLAVVYEVVEEEVACDEGVEHEVENDKVGHIEFPFSVLSVAPGSYLVQNVKLYHFDEHYHNYLSEELLMVKSPVRP